jgi:PAS domain S-box-containing protein
VKLSAKISLCLAVASLFAGEGIIVYSRKAVHNGLLAQIQADAELELHLLSAPLASAILSTDESRILPLVHSYLQNTEGLYAAVLDAHGRVLGHSNVAEAGKIYRDAETAAAIRSGRMVARAAVLKGRRVLELTFPVYDDSKTNADDDFLLSDARGSSKGALVGLLRVGVPLEKPTATESLIVGRIFRAVVGLGGITGILLFFFMRRLLAPVALLAAATAKIRAGDYGGCVPVTTDDEIGALARSFNDMSLELGRTTISKDFFNDILDSIQDQVIVTDAAGLIVLVNPAVIRLLGYSKDDLIGRHADILLASPDVSITTASYNAAAQFIAKSKEAVPVLFSSSVIVADDGRVTGYIGTAKDVSDLRKIEARMHQSEKLSAVGQLAAGVAHEINNPLGVILGFAQGMARQLHAGDALEMPIRSIEREALRCKALVQNLLTFARTSHSDRAAMDVNATIEAALSLVGPEAKINRVSISTDLAKGLPPVLGNKNQLEQVIMNLTKNAIDAMPNGGTLALSTEIVEQGPQTWVCLKLTDDGTGIPPAVISKIFDPFFTTKPIGKGTGLGLSLVSEIVQKHSGEISVDSRPGRTQFTVKLPARTGREQERRVETAVMGTISHG